MTILPTSANIEIARFRKRENMNDLKLYIEVVFYPDGTSERRVVREYVNWLNNTQYDILAKYKNNFLGKFRAKRKLAKWKKIS